MLMCFHGNITAPNGVKEGLSISGFQEEELLGEDGMGRQDPGRP